MERITLADWLKYGPHLRWYWRIKHRKIERLLKKAYSEYVSG